MGFFPHAHGKQAWCAIPKSFLFLFFFSIKVGKAVSTSNPQPNSHNMSIMDWLLSSSTKIEKKTPSSLITKLIFPPSTACAIIKVRKILAVSCAGK